MPESGGKRIMKAVVIKSVGVIEVQDVPEPECEPDEIKVKIAYAGICGSDPKIVDGTLGAAFPAGAIGDPLKTTPQREGVKILGHEASGTIVKIGKDVKGDFRIGQHVAMNFRKTCGGCYYCQNKMEHFCERVMPFVGVMADYGCFKESLVYPLPDDLPLDVGAFLEPLSIAVHTIDIAKMKVGDSVIITGGGPIGLLTLQLAVKAGAAKVLLSEPIAEKRELAKRFGADVIVDPLHEDLLAIANKFTDRRGFNVCIEATGIPALARQLILLSERCGSIVWAGVYPGNIDLGVPIFYMYSKELSVHSVKLAPYSFPRALQILPKLDLKPLITVYPLEDALKAFEAHKKGKDIKILLKT
jgi:(R,R)-butanediol dehydrogenase/meso-butanediol dehydrogenase/diacetyl reductase/L-iditol 2-dehydrogenase